jgi:hypothetical protein
MWEFARLAVIEAAAASESRGPKDSGIDPGGGCYENVTLPGCMLKCRHVPGLVLILSLLAARGFGLGVLVPAGSVWKYLDNGTDQGTAWRALDFEDEGWAEGPAELGYGDGDEATELSFGTNAASKHITYYFRHVFEVLDAASITNVEVGFLRDDGGIVYLNGTEIFRSNMPNGPINYLTRASSSGSSSTAFFRTNINPALLVRGQNILAVEVHQSSSSSSDVSFNLELLGSGAKEAPVVRIASPLRNAVFPSPTNILVTVEATDVDSPIAQVELFVGNKKIGDWTSAPYVAMWTNNWAGSHTLTAIARDTTGLATKSQPVRVVIGSGVLGNTVLLPAGSEWRYLDDGSNEGMGWRTASFNDSSWKLGRAQLGYGDGDETTSVSYGTNANNKFVTTYFRRRFEVADPADVSALIAKLLRDDGAVGYLNGTEVFRNNMPAGTITYLTLASGALGGDDEDEFVRIPINRTLLRAGENLLAVEVHQASTNSSDLSFDLELLGSDLPRIVRGPWLQSATPTSVIVRWRTDVAATAAVRYGTVAGNLDRLVQRGTLATEHELRVTNLEPNTIYYYSIGTPAGAVMGGPEMFFRTPPVPGSREPTRIWVLGDSGTANVNAENVRDAFYAFRGSAHTELCLLLGDNAYNAGLDSEYQRALFEMYSRVLPQMLLWSTVGNHETDQSSTFDGTIPYYQVFTLPRNGEAGGVPSGTEAYYSFDHANIHFVCLDVMTSSRAPNSAMLAWLEEDLASTDQEWIVAFWHHPPYSKGSHDSDTSTRQTEIRENIVPILDNYGVDLVLCGHSHAYERSFPLRGHYGFSSTLTAGMIRDAGDGRADSDGAYMKTKAEDGTVYVVAGSAGKVSGGSLDHPAMFLSLNRLGSLFLEIAGDRLEAKFIRDTGMIEDYFTIQKSPRLRIVRVGSEAVIAWPASASDFRLQSTPTLLVPNWRSFGPMPVVSGGELVVTNGLNDPARFYRLVRP